MVKTHEGRLLTTPEEISGHVAYLPTGNEYISLPTIRPADGAVERFGALHMGLVSLLEVCGPAPASKTPGGPGGPALLAPFVRADGSDLPLAGNLSWERLGHFIPRFHASFSGEGLTVEGTIFAPLGDKGFIYVLRAAAAPPGSSPRPRRITLGLRGQWGDTLQTVYTSGRVFGVHRAHHDRWTAGPVFEARSGPAILGWALMPSQTLDTCSWQPAPANALRPTPSDGGPRSGFGPGDFAVPAGEPITYEFSKTFTDVPPSAEVELAFYVGVNREGDGARTTAIDLARHGWRRLLARTNDWLEHKALTLPRARAGEREKLEEVANLNLFFNYFFALGRTIDSEELACVTSRSPLYYVSAAFWARDTLLWSLPAVLLVEPDAARQMLEACFTRYLRHAGIHSLYMDGSLLYPGFELDELCAYIIALEAYRHRTGDESLLRREDVAGGLRRMERMLFSKKHPTEWLFETFLYPSDDPATYPYVTYDNTLVALVLDILAGWVEKGLYAPPAAIATPAAAPATPATTNPDAAAYRRMAAAVRQAVFCHAVVPGPLGPMFAWSTDLGGDGSGDSAQTEGGVARTKVYDEPPGSLQLLSYYGLCPPDNEVFRNTVAWIHSEHNPHSYLDGRFKEVGCPHSEHPFVMSVFNSLLCGRVEEAKDILLGAPLDGGLACEAFDRHTGIVKTGAAFATCAGFLAYAMACAFGGQHLSGLGHEGRGLVAVAEQHGQGSPAGAVGHGVPDSGFVGQGLASLPIAPFACLPSASRSSATGRKTNTCHVYCFLERGVSFTTAGFRRVSRNSKDFGSLSK